jgi:hypothetical protein
VATGTRKHYGNPAAFGGPRRQKHEKDPAEAGRAKAYISDSPQVQRFP